MSEKKPASLLPAIYSQWIADFVVVARDHGYAIAVHGSMARDLDLIAVPWVGSPSTPDAFVQDLEHDLHLRMLPDDPSIKPHGRLAYTLLFDASTDLFVDLSIISPDHERQSDG